MIANQHIHTPLVRERYADSLRAAMGQASANVGNCAMPSPTRSRGIRALMAKAIGWIHSDASGPTAQAPRTCEASRSATSP